MGVYWHNGIHSARDKKRCGQVHTQSICDGFRLCTLHADWRKERQRTQPWALRPGRHTRSNWLKPSTRTAPVFWLSRTSLQTQLSPFPMSSPQLLTSPNLQSPVDIPQVGVGISSSYIEDHTAAVKALAWCPFQGNLLALGGGGSDRCIKFWNTHTGACLNSVDTGSQVCALLWNKNERELLSSHGFTQNQLTLWKYPSMVKIQELTGHTSRVLYMAQVLIILLVNLFIFIFWISCKVLILILLSSQFRAQMDVQ